MRKILVAANWKMNTTPTTAKKLIEAIIKEHDRGTYHDILICPPFTSLGVVSKHIQNNDISLGAQNHSQHDNGAYTGEISASMLKEIGCEYVILGHSERRKFFGESDKIISEKFDLAINKNLIPILCVGETLQEKENGIAKEAIEHQINSVLENFSLDLRLKYFYGFAVAYEPVWAIGTGLSATPEYAQEVHSFIRKLLQKKISKELAENTQILYGGSVNKDNADALFLMPDIDGGLIGGASLESSGFMAIARQKNK